MTADLILEAHGIEKTLGVGPAAVQALKGVSLSLEIGKLTLLRGPSGSGKTTLMSVLGGILMPSSGSVFIRGEMLTGRDEESLAAIRRSHVGFVFQSYNLFPTLSALQNVMLAVSVKDLRAKDARQKAQAALSAVGLDNRMKSYPSQLSGGEQQRVAIARAVVGKPSLLLADEPTAALDSENGRMIMGLLARLAVETPCAVLVVTHDERTIPYADRIIAMEDGRIVLERARLSDDGQKPCLKAGIYE